MLGVCVAHASKAYHVPVPAIEKVLAEHGNSGVGPMGIPSAWLPILRRAGFSPAVLHENRCENIAAGAWIISAVGTRKSSSKRRGKTRPNDRSPKAMTTPVRTLAVKEGVPAACITTAARHYGLPIKLFSAVLATEGAHVGEVHRNANGSEDFGPAQVNSIWLRRLKSEGITRAALIRDGCVNLSVGAWILAKAMKGATPSKRADWWRHVGDYNSHTPRLNLRYAREVWEHSRQAQQHK